MKKGAPTRGSRLKRRGKATATAHPPSHQAICLRAAMTAEGHGDLLLCIIQQHTTSNTNTQQPTGHTAYGIRPAASIFGLWSLVPRQIVERIAHPSALVGSAKPSTAHQRSAAQRRCSARAAISGPTIHSPTPPGRRIISSSSSSSSSSGDLGLSLCRKARNQRSRSRVELRAAAVDGQRQARLPYTVTAPRAWPWSWEAWPC
jgi:hypothetical protein